MNDFIQSLFINHPPAPAGGFADPLLPVRRSFGEGDPVLARQPRRVRTRARFSTRAKRVSAAA